MPPDAPESDARRAQLVAIGAVLLVALLLGLFALARPEPRLTGNNATSPDASLARLDASDGPLCVSGVSLPAATAGVRLALVERGGQSTRLEMRVGSDHGRQLGPVVGSIQPGGEAPVMALPRGSGLGPLTLCFKSSGPLSVLGRADANNNTLQESTLAGRPVPGDVSLEYFAAEKRSGLASVPVVFQRAALFRPSWVGPWTYWLLFFLAFAALAAAVLLLIRLARGSTSFGPRTVAAIAALTFLNALLWALITPAFNTPDELAHFTYVETLAAGALPDHDVGPGEQGNAYRPSTVYAAQLTATNIVQRKFVKPPWTAAQDAAFERSYNQLRDGPDTPYGLTPANVYTPLYYAPAVVAYKLGGFGNLFDRLFFVRLWSALLLALGVVFVILFAREMLPRPGWVAPIAGLAVAFQPMAVHIGGGVSNDNLMVAACAAALWLAARVLKRGISFWPVFGAIGALVVGYAAKPTALGIAPAVGFVLLVALLRSRRRTADLRTCLLAAALPMAAFALLYLLFGGGGGVTGVEGPAGASRPLSPTGFASYLWQWYLPAVGPMSEFWHGIPPVFRVFFGGFLADFNSLDTNFSDAFYVVALIIAAALLALVLRALWLRRDRLREQWPLVAFPLVAVAGTVMLIHVVGYLLFAQDGQVFAQGRYLFPLLAVFGLYVAAAGIGAGRRWGLAVSSAVVVALACTNIAGMILSLGRFYL